jgi:uncharacterized membrane protein HdeD (DUF308 family)
MTDRTRLSEGSAGPVLASMWAAMLLKALATILFAVLAFFWLGRDFANLPALFAVYAAVDGALSLLAATRGGGVSVRNHMALQGVVGLLAAAFAGLWAGINSPTLAIIIGVWAAASGVLEIAGALTLRRVMQRDWSLVASGGWSVAFGVMLLIHPGFDPWTLVRLMSAWALVLGFLMLLLAFRFRSPPRP